MQSPERMQPDAHLRAASLALAGLWPWRRMSMTPEITPTGSARSPAVSPAATVVGQASTHLPQRVQASSMVSTRLCRAVSNGSGMMPTIALFAYCRDRCREVIGAKLAPFPGCGAARSGAPLFRDLFKLRAGDDPGSAAHHSATLHAALRPGNNAPQRPLPPRPIEGP